MKLVDKRLRSMQDTSVEIATSIGLLEEYDLKKGEVNRMAIIGKSSQIKNGLGGNVKK